VAFQKIADLSEIPPGKTKFLRIETTPVLLARVRNEIFALHGRCPHQNNAFEGAMLFEYLVDCPWHHFEYDVRTGENYFPANVYPDDIPSLRGQLRPVKTYPVEVRGSEVWVDLE
jgi:nitrite reductase/ring-hydroxylating ferredoxin subunit